MKRYTYHDLVMARKIKNNYKEKVKNRVKELLTTYKVTNPTTLFKLISIDFTTVESLELLCIMNDVLEKEQNNNGN